MLPYEPPVSIMITGASAPELADIRTWLPDYKIHTTPGQHADLTIAFTTDPTGTRNLQISAANGSGDDETGKHTAGNTHSLPIQSFNKDTLRLVLELLARKGQEIYKNRYYEYAFLHANDAFLIADCDHRILNVNPTAVNKFGYKPEDFLSMDIRNLFLHEKDSKDLLKNICGDDEYKNDYVLQKKNGDEFPATVAAFMMNEDQGLFLVVIRDISKRRELEHIKGKQNQLTATGKMARIIAHELRNPLYNIVLASQLLHDTEAGLASEEQAIIKRNCQRIDDLIRQLLEPGQWNQLSVAPVRVAGIVDQALKQVQDRQQLKQVAIMASIDPELTIMADTQKMETALVNLVVNAIEAIEGEERGEIAIEAGVTGDSAFIRVSDNGRGMSIGAQQELFSPYYTTKPQGMGLGLVNTLQIIEAHGGSLKFESREGHGSVFSITFPHH